MTAIIIGNADASNSLDFALPFDGIEYLNFFTGADVLTRNLAGTGEASVVGTPVQAAGYVEFTTRTNYLLSQAAQAGAGTLIACARTVGVTSDQATHSKFISNYASGSIAGGGVGLHIRNSTNMAGLLTLNNGGAYQADWTEVVGGFSTWAVWAFRFSAGESRLDNITTGAADTNTFANSIAVSAGTFAIGSDRLVGGSGFIGRCDIASAMIVNRSITDDELTQAYAPMQYVAAAHGLTV